MPSAAHREANTSAPPPGAASRVGGGAVAWLRARTTEQQLFAIVLTALAVQIFVQYWGMRAPGLMWTGYAASEATGQGTYWSFYYATALARVGLPWLCVWLLLRPSPHELGFGWPDVRPRELLWIGLMLGAGTGIALVVLSSESYQSAYSGSRQPLWPALLRFSLFTLSATVPWELLHRGFLLNGLHTCLLRSGEAPRRAAALAILITACFETLFHLVKPPHEAIGMLIGSPLLSWFALRHRSIWIPVLGHLWIEALFFAMVLV